jgi:hypothetical protein
VLVVEEQLPSLIQKMLTTTIERHPPTFPWEYEPDSDLDYDVRDKAVDKTTNVENQTEEDR